MAEAVKTPETTVQTSQGIRCSHLCLAAHFNQCYEEVDFVRLAKTHGRWPAECEITGAKPIYPLEATQQCTVDPHNPRHVTDLKRALAAAENRCSVMRRILDRIEGKKPMSLDTVMLKVLRATLYAHKIDHDDVENIVGGVMARLGEAHRTAYWKGEDGNVHSKVLPPKSEASSRV